MLFQDARYKLSHKTVPRLKLSFASALARMIEDAVRTTRQEINDSWCSYGNLLV